MQLTIKLYRVLLLQGGEGPAAPVLHGEGEGEGDGEGEGGDAHLLGGEQGQQDTTHTGGGEAGPCVIEEG